MKNSSLLGSTSRAAMILVFSMTTGTAWSQGTVPATDSAAVHSLKQTLSTEAYSGILKSLVNPATLQNPVAVCAHCHAGEDVARYASTIGPMMQMLNPTNWFNPMAYWNMAAPMMDPQTYAKWYEAYVQKYGGLLGYGAPGAAGSTSDTE